MNKALKVTGIVAAAGAVIGIGTAITGNHPAAPRHTPPPAQAAPAATTTPPSADAKFTAWRYGPGYRKFQRVQADLNALESASASGTVPAAESDGQQLTADAEAAMLTPPPVAGRPYSLAMGFYALAGIDIASGQFTRAAAEMRKGTRAVGAATAAIVAATP